MRKEYSKPILEIKEYEVITTVADLSNGGTLPGIGEEGENGSVNWGDIH